MRIFQDIASNDRLLTNRIEQAALKAERHPESVILDNQIPTP